MNIRNYLAATGYEMNYVVAHPDDYKGLPLLIFLHGAGERGRNIDHLYRHAIPAMIKDGIEIPAVVLYPQCPGQFIWNNMVKELKEIIEKVAAEYEVDSSRICLTGSSMGGYGTWEMALTYPEMFSAIAPVAGGGVQWRTVRLKSVPVIAYHGDADDVVPIIMSEIMVDSAKKNGAQAELVRLQGLGHNDGINYAYRNTDLISRLLSYERTDFSHVYEPCEELF